MRRNAALAGDDDVNEFVLNLILRDDPPGTFPLPDLSNPELVQAIEDGFASGVAGDAKAILPKLRENLKANGSSQSQSRD